MAGAGRLLSAMSSRDGESAGGLKQQLAEICSLSKELATALRETIWVVDPENDNLDALKVRAERAPADAGNLSADTAQVLGLAAAGVLVAQDRLLPRDGTLHAHVVTLSWSGNHSTWVRYRKR